MRLTVILFLLWVSVTFAQKLVWDANPEPDLAGYKVYIGYASRTYELMVDVGNKTSLVLDPAEKRVRYLAVAAYDTAGNSSDYSVELVYAPPDTLFNCDCNRDGRTDALDYGLLRKFIGTKKFINGVLNPKYNANYDYNKDEKIDALDRGLYQKRCR